MTIGDSITEAKSGTPGEDSYRKALWAQLVAAGHRNLDFVGSRTGVLYNSDPPGEWDKDHEGHYGWRADEILNGRSSVPGQGKLSQWAATHAPDVALIHIGTNDANQGQSAASTVSEIGLIIDVLRARNPAVRVVVARVIPFTKSDSGRAAVLALNAKIPTLVDKSSPQSPVVIADMYSGYDPAWNFDMVHPGPSGNDWMAERWAEALTRNSLLGPPTSSPGTPSQSSTPGTPSASSSPATPSPPSSPGTPAVPSSTTTSSPSESPPASPPVRCDGLVATLIGTEGADRLVGTRRRDVIVSLSGDDWIDGGRGSDVICAGGGRDSVVGGYGGDWIDGGGGDDHIAAAEGNDAWVNGGPGDDLVLGGPGSDRIYGSTGNDRLFGRRGSDKLVGYDGQDVLLGGSGDDVLRGGPNVDLIRGGSGLDTCVSPRTAPGCE